MANCELKTLALRMFVSTWVNYANSLCDRAMREKNRNHCNAIISPNHYSLASNLAVSGESHSHRMATPFMLRSKSSFLPTCVRARTHERINLKFPRFAHQRWKFNGTTNHRCNFRTNINIEHILHRIRYVEIQYRIWWVLF